MVPFHYCWTLVYLCLWKYHSLIILHFVFNFNDHHINFHFHWMELHFQNLISILLNWFVFMMTAQIIQEDGIMIFIVYHALSLNQTHSSSLFLSKSSFYSIFAMIRDLLDSEDWNPSCYLGVRASVSTIQRQFVCRMIDQSCFSFHWCPFTGLIESCLMKMIHLLH